MWLAWSLSPFLWLASLVFACVVKSRNLLYDHVFRPYRSALTVVSVGNLSVGGTGKTPFCLWLFETLKFEGHKPALALRGYMSMAVESDEGRLYAAKLGSDCVFINADRRKSLHHMAARGFDLAILDDGFQHRCVARDLDIVLIDATHLPWEDALLPLGFFREPEGSLARAQVVILTRMDMVPAAQAAVAEQHLHERHPHLLILRARSSCAGLIDGNGVPVDSGGPYLLCSGIGRPEAFRVLADAAGLPVAGHIDFPDHHDYPQSSLDVMAARARGLQAAAILVTEKDAVKLRGRLSFPLVVMKMTLALEKEGREQLLSLLRHSRGKR